MDAYILVVVMMMPTQYSTYDDASNGFIRCGDIRCLVECVIAKKNWWSLASYHNIMDKRIIFTGVMLCIKHWLFILYICLYVKGWDGRLRRKEEKIIWISPKVIAKEIIYKP